MPGPLVITPGKRSGDVYVSSGLQSSYLTATVIQCLSGGASNTSASASLGGAMSRATAGVIQDSIPNNLWRDITTSEHLAGLTIYRCWYLFNPTMFPAYGVSLWVSDQGSGSADSSIDISLDAAAIGSQASETIANESTAPSSSTIPSGWTRPTNSTGALIVGTISPGQFKAVWERLTITNGGASQARDLPTVTAGFSLT